MVMIRRAAVALFAFSVAFSASGQSASLYGTSVSESQVLVRLVNVGSSTPASFRLGPVRLTASQPGDATDYHPIAADIYVLRHGGRSTEFIPEQNSLYTILVGAEDFWVLKDEAHKDPVRVQLYVYNSAVSRTSGANAAPALYLRTTDGATDIVGPDAAGASASRIVNPVRLSAVLVPNAEEPIAVGPLDLERGRSYSFFLLGGDRPGYTVVPARVSGD